MAKLIDAVTVTTAHALREWLNGLDDAETVYLNMTGSPVRFMLIESTLTDGSTVQDIRISSYVQERTQS